MTTETTETQQTFQTYAAISENLRTLEKKVAQNIGLEDYQRRFNVILTDKGRRNLASIKSKMRKDASGIQRPTTTGPVPRMEPNTILHSFPIGDMASETIIHLKRLLPGILEVALKKLGASPPPLKVVQVEEEGAEMALEVRSK